MLEIAGAILLAVVVLPIALAILSDPGRAIGAVFSLFCFLMVAGIFGTIFLM